MRENTETMEEVALVVFIEGFIQVVILFLEKTFEIFQLLVQLFYTRKNIE